MKYNSVNNPLTAQFNHSAAFMLLVGNYHIKSSIFPMFKLLQLQITVVYMTAIATVLSRSLSFSRSVSIQMSNFIYITVLNP